MTALEIYSLDDENENTILSTFSEGEHLIGRDKLNCKDKRVSRNHAIIIVTENDVTLKSTHVNPSFYKPCGGNSIKLVKTDETVVINDGDQFGFLADACWFKTRVVERNNGIKRACHSIEPEDGIKKVKNSEDEDSSPNVQNEPIDSVLKVAQSNSDNSIDFADALLKSNEQQNELLEPDKPIVDDKDGQLDENVTTEVSNVNSNELEEETDKNESVDTELNKPNDSTSNNDDLPMKKTKQKCWYGATCYRKNIGHKQEFSHPGDSDFDDNDVPDCPFGSACYRTNILHRQQYKHSNPPAPKPAVNPNAGNTSNQINSDDEDSSDSNTTSKKKRKAATKVKYTDTPEDDYDLEDPFINDHSSDDYEASDDNDTDSDWQDSQEVEEESQERKRLLKEAKRFTKKKKQK